MLTGALFLVGIAILTESQPSFNLKIYKFRPVTCIFIAFILHRLPYLEKEILKERTFTAILALMHICLYDEDQNGEKEFLPGFPFAVR